MAKRWGGGLIVTVLMLSLLGCGGVRYSQVAPEAKDFHPRRIAVLPADARAFPDAKGLVDRLFVQALNGKRWFQGVVGADELGQRLAADQELRQAVTGYLEKLDKLNFSDSELSGRIGDQLDAEALLLLRVDNWHYTQDKDTKLAKVGLSVTMVQSKTGKILWTAGQNRTSDYLLLKPELAGMAEGVISELLQQMPR